MLNMMYLALNPNLSIDDVEKLLEADRNHKKELLDKMTENMKSMPIEQKLNYISTMIPFIF